MTSFSFNRRQFLVSSAAATCGAVMGVGPGGRWGRAEAAGARGKSLIIHSESPLNGEPAPIDLVRNWITPTKYFYVRTNGSTPVLDAATFRLRVTGHVERELEMSVAELCEVFSAESTVATLICAGCRRSELSREKPVAGVPWGVGPIGNAEWTGVSLAAVLRRAGVKAGAKHVWFESVDRVEKEGRGFAFGSSVPLEKALSGEHATPGALLATEMNGQALEPSHGFPLRVVVPGYIGARSVKWLGRIVVSDRPNPNYFMSKSYKLAAEADAAWDQIAPIYEYPINAAVCDVKTSGDGARRMLVEGYALPPGLAGRVVSRVEVSGDGGTRWTTAQFRDPPRQFCWRLWKAEVPVAASTREVIVRATDSQGAVQPEKAAWNVGGYLCNGWHRAAI